MKASVIIPFFEMDESVKLTVDALANQTCNKEDFEIILIDNSPSGTSVKFEPFENLVLLHEPQPGQFAARNLGCSKARGDVLLFTDADCIPDRHWVERMIRSLESGADRVGGRIELIPSSRKPGFVEQFEIATTFDQPRSLKFRGHLVTANMGVTKSCFLAVGPFNQTCLSGGDLEWSLRFNRLGFLSRFDESAIVSHPTRRTLWALMRHRVRLSGNVVCQNGLKNRIAWLVKVSSFNRGAASKIWRSHEARLLSRFAISAIGLFLHIWMISCSVVFAMGIRPPRK